jgi:two-component system, chemotaxis family, chemotaxis protein CheY
MTTPNASQPPVPAKGPSLRILYADDVRELRHVAHLSLSRDGHRVECVTDGDEALAKLSVAPLDYDVLITDHHMPRMDGLVLVTRLRTLPFTGKIIVFSSSLSPEVDAAYRKLRVDHLLKKPVYPSVLRDLLVKI